jgi:hypothetical protein
MDEVSEGEVTVRSVHSLARFWLRGGGGGGGGLAMVIAVALSLSCPCVGIAKRKAK